MSITPSTASQRFSLLKLKQKTIATVTRKIASWFIGAKLLKPHKVLPCSIIRATATTQDIE
jgi:hypothetical protein